MEPQTGKRMVSKGEYAKAMGQRATLGLSGGLCFAFAFIFGLATLIFLLSAFNNGAGQAAVFVCGCLAFLCCLGGKISLDRACNIDPGTPLTRANAADLPAPDTLVRASTEPEQAQQAILLRPATGESQETLTKQLVRPVNGQE